MMGSDFYVPEDWRSMKIKCLGNRRMEWKWSVSYRDNLSREYVLVTTITADDMDVEKCFFIVFFCEELEDNTHTYRHIKN